MSEILTAISWGYEVIGIYKEREGGVFKSFYYLIKPFTLHGEPSLLFSSFAGIYYRLKSGRSL
jgi:hypothetical protein